MVFTKDIHWLAGLLEGEGTFVWNANSPRIKLSMTDKDVVERARALMSPLSHISVYQNNGNSKNIHQFQLNSCLAIQWMMTIYGLMGKRRRKQIKNVLFEWNNTKAKHQSNRMLKSRAKSDFYRKIGVIK